MNKSEVLTLLQICCIVSTLENNVKCTEFCEFLGTLAIGANLQYFHLKFNADFIFNHGQFFKKMMN